MKVGECVFCNRQLDKGIRLFETVNFFVNVGVGITAPGHVMLITKNHYPCYGDMDDNLWGEYRELRELVFNKVKEAFSEPFLVEYGQLEQSVPHAHVHFIPKIREKTAYYPDYKIGHLFREIGVPDSLLENTMDLQDSRDIRKKFGGYIYMENSGKPYLFYRFPADYSSKNLSYRRFFGEKYNIFDIPTSWKEMTEKMRQVDSFRRNLTRSLIRF